MWTAIPLPSDFGATPDDVVLVSQHGYGNTRLAGGDQDGDLNMIHWNESLIRIIEGTEEVVQHVDVSAHDHEVEEEVNAIVKNPTKAMLHFRRSLLSSPGSLMSSIALPYPHRASGAAVAQWPSGSTIARWLTRRTQS